MLTSLRSLVGRLVALAALTAVVAPLTLAQGADPGWPRELTSDSGQIIIYQPQIEKLDGIQLTGRSAVATIKKGQTTPVFGVVWYSARALTDRDNRTVAIDNVVVTNARFPGFDDAKEKSFRAIVNPLIDGWQFTMALDRFQAGLAEAAAEQRSADSLDNTPPAVVFSSVPAALLLYSGDPIFRPLPNTSLTSAVNTPMLVVYDSAAKMYYLNGGPLWYSAADPIGPWKKIAKPPAVVSAVVPDSIQRDSAPPGAPPVIVVATKPTELFVITGAPQWKPITGADLLYVSNSDRDIFKDLGTQRTFILIAGRWFASASFDGPWTFVRPDSLPKAFAKIPANSEKADVLASVPGTSQARDAVLDAQIPQTAAIDRATAKLTVTYDGDPKFTDITGTGVSYATNTSTQVLRIGGRFYACDQGVWFSSIGPFGPWAVSDSVPKAVDSIPPSAPVYNVKYVQVYQSTPTVVYVGYTPGYMWGYPYYGTVVYGTGYYYRPYVGPVYYYPPPITYGVAIRYNPWTGWTVGFGYSTPFMHVGVVVRPPYYGGWYGPYRRPPYPPPYYRPPYGGYPGYRPPPPGYRPGAPGYRPPGGYPTPYGSHNIYRQPSNAGRVAPPSAVTRDVQAGNLAKGHPNNVVAGKDGNVYRQNGNNSWQQNQGGKWNSPSGGAQPSTRPANQPANKPSTQPANKPATQPANKPATQPANRPSTQPATRPSSGVPNDVNKTM